MAGILFGLAPSLARAAAADPFAHWAAVIVSGDFHAAHTDRPTRAFDNARRDVAAAFERRGFSAENVLQFSADADRRAEPATKPAQIAQILAGLTRLAGTARDGCLIYLTSHGSPDGVVLGEFLVPPPIMAAMAAKACGKRPTIVVISACFSGGFVPALQGPDRMVITAARRDRSSFGCGEGDRYPFFDGCMLEAVPAARDFIALARAARACVARRERAQRLAPASEPQIFVGGDIRRRLEDSPFPSG
jgi:hypothetical protein